MLKAWQMERCKLKSADQWPLQSDGAVECLSDFKSRARDLLQAETDPADLTVLAAMYDLLAETALALTRQQRSPDHLVIQAVDAYIANHYQQKVSLSVIANHVHMNESYLSRLYHRLNGITITEAIARYRIERACVLLADPHRLMKEVAWEVGIQDPAYFSVLFRRYRQMSPREFQLNTNKKIPAS